MNPRNIGPFRLAVLCTLVLSFAGCKKEENRKLTLLTAYDGKFTVEFNDLQECIKKHSDLFPNHKKLLSVIRNELETDPNGIITYDSYHREMLAYTLIQDKVPMTVRCSKCQKEIPINEIIESRSTRGPVGGLDYKDNQGHILLFVALWVM